METDAWGKNWALCFGIKKGFPGYLVCFCALFFILGYSLVLGFFRVNNNFVIKKTKNPIFFFPVPQILTFLKIFPKLVAPPTKFLFLLREIG